MRFQFKNLFIVPILAITFYTNTIKPSYSRPLDSRLNLISKPYESKKNLELKKGKRATFDDAFFSHTKPYVEETTMAARLKSFFGITIGGKNQNTFYGIGFKDKSIQWDATAVENLYWKRIEKHYLQYQLTGGDIPNGYDESLLGSHSR